MEASGSSSFDAPISITGSRDLVDDLIKKPFALWPVEAKIQLMLQDPPRPKLNIFLTEKAERPNQSIQLDLFYEMFEWICGSERNNALYCWPCLLMAKKLKCLYVEGISEISGFRSNASKHPKTKEHKSCVLQIAMEKHRMSNKNKISQLQVAENLLKEKFNDKVKKNQEIMKQIMDMVFITVTDYQDRSLKFDSIIKLLNLTWESKPEIKNHWLNQNYFSTDQSFLNILLECMKEELIIFMEKEIKNCKFYSCYCDDLFNITGTNHCSLSLRLVDGKGVSHEYFLGFFELSENRNPEDMFALLFNNLRLYNIKEKLVAYTYDGTSVATGKQIEFQNIMSKMVPGSLYSTCFSRPLLAVVLESCSKTLKLNEFFAHFEGIMNFLTKLRPYHIESLEEIIQNNFELPKAEYPDLVTCKNITFILTQRERLLFIFKKILLSMNYNAEIISKADFYSEKLSELDFLFYLNVFKDVLSSIIVLEMSLQKCFKNRNFQTHGIQAVSRCLVTLNNWKSDAFFLAHIAGMQLGNKTLVLGVKVVESFKAKYFQILETVIRLLGERFLTFEKFDFMQIMDGRINEIPLIRSAASNYNIFDMPKLSNETDCLSDPRVTSFKDQTLQDVVKKMADKNFNKLVPNTYLLFTLLLTLPLSDEDTEFSCYRRVRKYLRNLSPLENLFSPYALLFIEQDTLKRLKEKETFYDDVIKRFCKTTAGFNICVPLVLK